MKTVGKIVLAGVILMVLAVGGCIALVGGVANEVDKSIKEDADTVTTVKYEVTGGQGADVTYSKNGSGQTSQDNGAKTPWSKTVKIKGDPSLDTYTVLAQNSGTGEIGCKISVDGKVVNENSSKGQFAVVDCTYTQDIN
jgi:hypothetical protein